MCIIEQADFKKYIEGNKDSRCFKFVKVDGKYRFTKMNIYGLNHKELVEKGETAEAAGGITIHDNDVRLSMRDSMTLGIRSSEDELKEIAAIIGLKAANEYGGPIYDSEGH